MNAITIEIVDWPGALPVTNELTDPNTAYGKALIGLLRPFNEKGVDFGAIKIEHGGKTVTVQAKNLAPAGR